MTNRSKITTGIVEFSFIAGLVLIIVLVFLGCKHEPILPVLNTDDSGGTGGGDTTSYYSGTPCDSDSVYFQNTILPLFVSNCAKSGCHDPASHEEGIILNSYNSIMASGEITPGNPSRGDIMEAITSHDPDKVMPPPPNTALNQDQIDLIADWISQGAMNNSCDGGCDTTNVTYSATIAPLIQAKCRGCHNNTTTSGNVNLDSYPGVQLQALNGHMLGTVRHEQGFAAMPKGGAKLPDCEIDEIRIWIEAGAPNN